MPVAVIVALVGGMVLAAAARGALGVSRNDDWVYYRVAFASAQHGVFAPDPYTRTMLLGLDRLAQPVIWLFGPSITALQVTVAAVAALGMVAAFRHLCLFLGAPWALLAVSVAMVSPLFTTSAVSFMSDAPAFALQALGLYAACRAYTRGRASTGWFGLSLVAALAAFTVREYAVAVVLALAATLVVKARYLSGSEIAARTGGLLVWLVVAGLLYRWRGTLTPGGAQVSVDLTPQLSFLIDQGARAVGSTALGVAPLVVTGAVAVCVYAARARWGSSAWSSRVARVLVLLMLLAGVLVGLRKTKTFGNIVTAWGAYPEASSPPVQIVLGSWAWRGVGVVAALGLVLVLLASARFAAALVSRARQRGAGSGAVPLAVGSGRPTASAALMLARFFVLAQLATVVSISVVLRSGALDRYLLPVLPYAAGLVIHVLLRSRLTQSVVVRAALLVGLLGHVLLGTVVTDHAAARDGLKWSMSQGLARSGWPAEKIDGGMEWFGLHQSGDLVRPVPVDGNLWVGMFPGAKTCVVLMDAGQPLPPGGRVVAEATSNRVLGEPVALRAVVSTSQAADPSCPRLPSRSVAVPSD